MMVLKVEGEEKEDMKGKMEKREREKRSTDFEWRKEGEMFY